MDLARPYIQDTPSLEVTCVRIMFPMDGHFYAMYTWNRVIAYIFLIIIRDLKASWKQHNIKTEAGAV